MTRVEFTLAMPGRASWDGAWSGEGRNYALVRELDDESAAQLDGRSWSYGWPDGWRAEVRARIVRESEALGTSHGFHGYDWMIASILRHGTIYADHEVPSSVAARDKAPAANIEVETETDVAVRLAKILVANSAGERDSVLVLARAVVKMQPVVTAACAVVDEIDERDPVAAAPSDAITAWNVAKAEVLMGAVAAYRKEPSDD